MIPPPRMRASVCAIANSEAAEATVVACVAPPAGGGQEPPTGPIHMLRPTLRTRPRRARTPGPRRVACKTAQRGLCAGRTAHHQRRRSSSAASWHSHDPLLDVVTVDTGWGDDNSVPPTAAYALTRRGGGRAAVIAGGGANRTERILAALQPPRDGAADVGWIILPSLGSMWGALSPEMQLAPCSWPVDLAGQSHSFAVQCERPVGLLRVAVII